MSVKIRRMLESDAKRVAELEVETFSMPWSEQGLKDTLGSNQSLFLVAEKEDGDIAGYVGMTFAADEGEITNIAVFSDMRRRGIAERLMKELSKESRKLELAFIFLDVRVSNEPAIALYKKMNYEFCGLRKRFYEKPTEDAYIYKLSLN